ncbi:hypothetical protein AB1Y20_003078 [Prymnesium parvum]|uniref:Uncharacterized protein n=1 Tax=Prymnesium parvum TaxID=97485 RepID=A0AB34JCT3_PRYPA
MAVSNCNKEVATRLFRMLAISEASVDAVKRDHASYAKLSLLTQQASLLQRQAEQVVQKSCLCAAAADGELRTAKIESCSPVALECSDGAMQLLSKLPVSQKAMDLITRDQASCAKLSLLSEQVGLLKQQAQQVIEEAELNRRLVEVSASSVCRLVPGTVYYHYTQHGREVVSRVADDEWANYEKFHGKYLYDFDFAFRKLEDPEVELGQACAPMLSCFAPTASISPKTVDECHTSPEPRVTGVPINRPKPICGVLSRW